ncbi:MAG TPA: hypothetical protein DCQ98_05885 [Planctomycetaceae bacterium]|nr:hypothetical protein [Planctomycetaceae bacterium]
MGDSQVDLGKEACEVAGGPVAKPVDRLGGCDKQPADCGGRSDMRDDPLAPGPHGLGPRPDEVEGTSRRKQPECQSLEPAGRAVHRASFLGIGRRGAGRAARGTSDL